MSERNRTQVHITKKPDGMTHVYVVSTKFSLTLSTTAYTYVQDAEMLRMNALILQQLAERYRMYGPYNMHLSGTIMDVVFGMEDEYGEQH